VTSLNFQLLKWQQEVFKDKTRFKVIAAGRRCGKSRLATMMLIIKALEAPEGSAVLYVSPTLGQSRQIIWDSLLEIGKPVIKSAHINNLDITLVNGRKIHVRGADNSDTLRGLSLYYAVLDECAFIKQDTWEKIIRASLSDRKGEAMFISTPSGRNWFYEMYKLGVEQEDPEWKAWHFTTKDNETIDPKEVDAARKTLSSFAFKQEYEASFDNAGQEIFKEEWLRYGEDPQYGDYVIAIDLAGFEDVAKNAGASKKRLDESAIAIVKVEPQGDWFVEKILHGRWDIKETANKILRVVHEYQPSAVGIERGALKNAVAPYLNDLMRKHNVYFHITDLTHGNKKKTERIAWALQGRFEWGRITLNKEEDWRELVDQLLLFPTANVHDDLVDALAYVDQLTTSNYQQDYDDDEWEPIDIVAGV
jgi:predicted phage terminase large subunit-like protein